MPRRAEVPPSRPKASGRAAACVVAVFSVCAGGLRRTAEASPIRTRERARPLTLLGGRLAMVAVATVVLWALLRPTLDIDAFPPSPLWAMVGLLPVTVACLLWMRRLFREEGVSLGMPLASAAAGAPWLA